MCISIIYHTNACTYAYCCFLLMLKLIVCTNTKMYFRINKNTLFTREFPWQIKIGDEKEDEMNGRANEGEMLKFRNLS